MKDPKNTLAAEDEQLTPEMLDELTNGKGDDDDE